MQDAPSYIVGVDVDPGLISEAQKAAAHAGWSRPSKKDDWQGIAGELGHSIGAASIASSKRNTPRRRLNLSTKRVAGFWACNWLYCDQESEWKSDVTPSDEQYRAFRIARDVHQQDQQGYDLILALSVTKWIHLAHFDTGLRRFFARIAKVLCPGGVFIVEPQPSKSYKSLHKVTKPDSQQRQNWKSMRVMPEDFAWILTHELGLVGPYLIRDRSKGDGE